MTVYDMCQTGYNAQWESPADLKGRSHWLQRRFLGSDLTALSTTATDNFKIFKIGKYQSVKGYKVIVWIADNTSITVSLGFYDTSAASASATMFASAAVNLNSAATTFAVAATAKTFDAEGDYIILTLSDLANLDAATEFEIGIEVVESSGNVSGTLTVPV